MIELYFVFFKVSIATFGGGLAMLPNLLHEVVDKRNWASKDELLDYYVIGQCTPGVIAVNIATFIGYKRNGILGGFVATLGMITPSILLACIVGGLIQYLIPAMENPEVVAVLKGIVLAVNVLIVTTVTKMFREIKLIYWEHILMIVGIPILMSFFGFPIVVIVLMCCIFGWFRYELNNFN